MLNQPARCGFFDDPPIPFLLFKLIGNLHGGACGCSSFGAEADDGGSLITLNDDGGEIRIEGLHVEGAERGEVLAHRGTDGFVVGRLLFATRDESKSQSTRRDGDFAKRLLHRDLIQNCSAIFVRTRTLIPAAFASGAVRKTAATS